jgi:hypothetical protein
MTDLLTPKPKGPVRFSHLKAYGRSALHGYHARTAPEEDPTYAMERGTCVHALLFDTRRVCGYPGKTRQGKKFEDFVAANPDSEILTMAEYDKARRMADAVRQHKLAWPLLQGVREETLLFRWNGMECRSTPDNRGENFITELKSAPSADPEIFPWHSRRMKYHVQVRFEALAFERKFGRAPNDCYIVVVEHTAPHAVQVFRVDERAFEIADRQLMLWSERLKVAEGSGAYPPYTMLVSPLGVPGDDGDEDDDDAGLVFPAPRAGAFDQLQEEHGVQI